MARRRFKRKLRKLWKDRVSGIKYKPCTHAIMYLDNTLFYPLVQTFRSRLVHYAIYSAYIATKYGFQQCIVSSHDLHTPGNGITYYYLCHLLNYMQQLNQA